MIGKVQKYSSLVDTMETMNDVEYRSFQTMCRAPQVETVKVNEWPRD
jgi:hypothetical protein